MKKKNQTSNDDFGTNFNKALRFLSFRPRSEKEIRDYLIKKSFLVKVSEEQEKNHLESIINSVIEKLKEQKFINDTEFVKWWIEQRTSIKPRALRLIKFELKQKGIAKELIEQILEDKDFETVSDFDKAIKLAQKRMLRYKNETPKKVYEKMTRFLASKGFDYATIKEVIDRILSKAYNG